MRPSVYDIEIEIAGALCLMPKPSAEWLREDMKIYRSMGIDHIISLLCQDEIEELGLHEERDACRDTGMRFTRFEIADRGLPDVSQLVPLAETLAGEIAEGASLAVHCRAGIGRSGLVASCILQHLGLTASEAIARVSEGRGVKIPDTQEQANFILEYRSSIGRGTN